MKQQEYLSSLGKKKLYRVLAWVCLFIIAGLIIATFITGITGSKYFMGFLVLTLVIPFFMYVVLWLGKVLSGVGEKKNRQDDMDEQ